MLLPAFKQFERAAASGKPIAKRFNEEVAGERLLRNYAPDQPLARQDMADIAELMLEDFYIMEKAGVPRKLTGKLISDLRGPGGLYENQAFKNMFVGSPSMEGLTELNRYARALGLTLRDMKGMTNDQRETFLQLLPRWTGSMQSAAAAAKKLYRR